jgi:DTW domain-containing protein
MPKRSPERKRKTKEPCSRCGLHLARCICSLIPKLDLKTRVLLVIHAKELKRTTNTGRLALEALSNSGLRVRGEGRVPLDLSHDLDTQYETVVLYPSDDAIELSDLKATKPIQLIVPDGNWRQAGKMKGRQPELKGLKSVKVSEVMPAAGQTLRKEHFEGGKSTLEAIAQALHVIEGAAASEPLFVLYRAKLAATLEGRGVVPAYT